MTKPVLSAVALGHINKVLAWLDNGGHHQAKFDLNSGSLTREPGGEEEFDDHMDELEIEHGSCGSVCCIAGALMQSGSDVFGKAPDDTWPEILLSNNWPAIQKGALDILEVPLRQRPPGYDFFDLFDVRVDDVTAAEGATALRNWVETGTPDWEAIQEARY